jgi:hypothetical protein
MLQHCLAVATTMSVERKTLEQYDLELLALIEHLKIECETLTADIQAGFAVWGMHLSNERARANTDAALARFRTKYIEVDEDEAGIIP